MAETVDRDERRAPPSATGRKAGYVVAAAIDLVLLWVVNQLLGWGWPPFLTEQFEDLLPWLDVSFVAGAAVNLLWVVWEPAWLKHLGQAALNLIGVAVAVRTWHVFPFDVSSGWETTFRVVLVVAAVGASLATIVELAKLAWTGHHEVPGTSSAHPA